MDIAEAEAAREFIVRRFDPVRHPESAGLSPLRSDDAIGGDNAEDVEPPSPPCSLNIGIVIGTP